MSTAILDQAPAIDQDRLWADLMAIGEITEPGRPYTRRSFTPLFVEGRAFLRRQLESFGAAVHIDAAGNLIGRIEGSDPTLGAIAIGSHSDTVPAGGRFDGVAGVIAGLEVLRAIAQSGWSPRHPIELIDFLAEEPSDFGLSCIGSRGMTAQLDDAMLAMTDSTGRVLSDAMIEVGGDATQLAAAERTDIAAFLEMHIEQGPVLEDQGIDIGVVGTIVAIRRIEILFEGRAAHAGTAPMHLRRDAAVAGAATLVAINRTARALAEAGEGYFVATVGIVEVKPGGSNVVPRTCRLVIDARSDRPELIDRFEEAINRISLADADEARVQRTGFAVLSDGVPAHCDTGLQDHIRAASADLGYTSLDMASGAGHDAAFMARICPVGMVFIPCREGHSHTPIEWAEPGQVGAGAAVLLNVVRRLDQQGF
jgi:N-carbamoyl-L-amino-acid hydrolase